MRLLITDRSQYFVGIFNDRRAFIRTDRRNTLNHIRDFICVCDDNLLCLFLTEIIKFRKHFLRCAQIKRRLVIGIGKALAGHNDTSVKRILGI